MSARTGWIGTTLLAAMLVAATAATGRAAVNPGLAAKPLPVRITLRDGGFSFRDIGIRATSMALEVSNKGHRKHALAIAARGPGDTLQIETPVLPPGATTKLILRLPAGRYEIFSPVGHDRDHGLAAPMKVITPSPPGSDGAEMDRVFYNY